ncbi:MAG: hypothetical protein LBL35_03570 [Clostridiales bacterium]|nr:hypothetical protein [Clostridiales bacterium]
MGNEDKINDIMEGMSEGPAKKTIPMFFLVDMSGSMCGSRIAAVNNAMNQLWPELKKIQGQERLFDIQARVITFGMNGAQWKVGGLNKGVNADDFVWNDIPANEPCGGTPTEQAIELLLTCVGDDVYREYIGRRFSLPFMLLISDGESNDAALYSRAVEKLVSTKIGEKAIMCAIGIETTNNPRAAEELKVFGRNGFRDCSDMDLSKLADLISVATFRTIKLSGDQNGAKNDVFEDDPDVF